MLHTSSFILSFFLQNWKIHKYNWDFTFLCHNHGFEVGTFYHEIIRQEKNCILVCLNFWKKLLHLLKPSKEYCKFWGLVKSKFCDKKVTKAMVQKSFFCIFGLIIYPPISLKQPMDVFISFLKLLNFHSFSHRGAK